MWMHAGLYASLLELLLFINMIKYLKYVIKLVELYGQFFNRFRQYHNTLTITNKYKWICSFILAIIINIVRFEIKFDIASILNASQGVNTLLMFSMYFNIAPKMTITNIHTTVFFNMRMKVV